jgi:hypothetical protein
MFSVTIGADFAKGESAGTTRNLVYRVTRNFSIPEYKYIDRDFPAKSSIDRYVADTNAHRFRRGPLGKAKFALRRRTPLPLRFDKT